MAKKTLKAVLDTNIIVSALVFGGKPEEILRLVLEHDILASTSLALILELEETLINKFAFSEKKLKQVEEKIKNSFETVNPILEINVLNDKDDNRVLEAAVEGNCDYIITGDKELLRLKHFRGVNIVTPEQFLKTKE